LDKLHHYNGFRGILNKWFLSYLEDRTQTTQIGSFISLEKNITFGVPQGSVLGPRLLLNYINPLTFSAPTCAVSDMGHFHWL